MQQIQSSFGTHWNNIIDNITAINLHSWFVLKSNFSINCLIICLFLSILAYLSIPVISLNYSYVRWQIINILRFILALYSRKIHFQQRDWFFFMFHFFLCFTFLLISIWDVCMLLYPANQFSWLRSSNYAYDLQTDFFRQ